MPKSPFQLFVPVLLCNAAFALYRWEARRRRPPLFPKDFVEPVLYKENRASGNSLKNLLTEFGGARNCLRLRVTQNELWTWSMFSLLDDLIDVEHRILKQNIIAFKEQRDLFGRGSLCIEYRKVSGGVSRIEIFPRNFDAFMQALQLSASNKTDVEATQVSPL